MIIRILDRSGDIKFTPKDDEDYRRIMRNNIYPMMHKNGMVLCMQKGQQIQEQVPYASNFEKTIDRARDADVLYLRPSITAG